MTENEQRIPEAPAAADHVLDVQDLDLEAGGFYVTCLSLASVVDEN
ncbi:MAG TPA: hypothetical protein VFN97_05275 [Actinospica sp.]|nr:hypothetical protein [Actinospica sp.]